MTDEARRTGRLEGAIARLFMKSATVSECQVLSEQFRLVTLRDPALQGVKWTPGQKVQVALGGWTNRTYTPLCWNTEEGRTQLLLFLHGDTPGAGWGRALKVGDSCTLFGPRDSLDLSTLGRPALLLGDETSFALAHSLRSTLQGSKDVRFVFEVSSQEVSKSVLQHLDIADAELIERKPGDAHMSIIEEIIAASYQDKTAKSFALSGKATSIQRVSKRLRALGVPRSQIKTRAYWSPGKVGLD